MPSSQLPSDDAIDLLQSWSAKSAKLQANFESKAVSFSIIGRLTILASRFWLLADNRREHLSFDGLHAVDFGHGDEASVKTEDPGCAEFLTERFTSALTMQFSDGSVLSLYELSDAKPDA